MSEHDNTQEPVIEQEIPELDEVLDQIEEQQKPAPASKQVAPPPPSAPVAKFQRFQRGSQTYEHHLMKLLVAKMKKNISYKWRQPDIIEMEHTHFFHSINDTTMQPNKYCSPVGGHFHEVTLVTDKDGNIVDAKCGPALEKVQIKTPAGPINRVRKVRFERHNMSTVEQLDEDGNPIEVQQVIREFDNHTHELEYFGSETFTANSKVEARRNEQAKVKSSMDGPAAIQAAKLASLNSGEKAEVAKRHLSETETPRPKGMPTASAGTAPQQ